MKMEDCASTVNNIIDAHYAHNEEHSWIKDILADLEDRSRRNNVKIRGIAEDLQAHNLSSYARGIIKALLPELKNI